MGLLIPLWDSRNEKWVKAIGSSVSSKGLEDLFKGKESDRKSLHLHFGVSQFRDLKILEAGEKIDPLAHSLPPKLYQEVDKLSCCEGHRHWAPSDLTRPCVLNPTSGGLKACFMPPTWSLRVSETLPVRCLSWRVTVSLACFLSSLCSPPCGFSQSSCSLPRPHSALASSLLPHQPPSPGSSLYRAALRSHDPIFGGSKGINSFPCSELSSSTVRPAPGLCSEATPSQLPSQTPYLEYLEPSPFSL